MAQDFSFNRVSAAALRAHSIPRRAAETDSIGADADDAIPIIASRDHWRTLRKVPRQETVRQCDDGV